MGKLETDPIQAVEGHALEAVTWSFHVAVEHHLRPRDDV
jgi:hypothetical protein